MEELLQATGAVSKEKSIISVDINITLVARLKNLIQWVLAVAKRHKIKTVVVIVALVLARKSFNAYKWIRELIAPISTGDSENQMIMSRNLSHEAIKNFMQQIGPKEGQLTIKIF